MGGCASSKPVEIPAKVSVKSPKRGPEPVKTVGNARSVNRKSVTKANMSGGPLNGPKKLLNERSSLISLETHESRAKIAVIGETMRFSMTYHSVCQRGYYPNSPNKANQDSFLICENVLGDSNCHLFGVFDGHGEFGDLCSHYSADQVHVILKTLLKSTHSYYCIYIMKMAIIDCCAYVFNIGANYLYFNIL